MENATFTIRFDSRTKAVILQTLQEAHTQAMGVIIEGDYSTEAVTRAEELSRVVRGILYTRPQGVLEVEEPVVEEPVVGPEAGANREPRVAKEDILDNLPE